MVAVTDRHDASSRARDLFAASLPDHFERLHLPPPALAEMQTDRLRSVLRRALEGSPFHRGRLAGIDVDSFTLADLPGLPVMTKAQMMASFDEVVTDRRITLDVAERHLATAGDRCSLALDEFVVMGSGGSSGVRGVFVSDVPAAAEQMAAVVRGGLAGLAATLGWPPPGPAPVAIVAAPTSVHATRALSSLFMQGGVADITYAPVTMPFVDVRDVVERARPMLLIGYPSIVAGLADARREGRLSIAPETVIVTSEQLTTAQADRINDGFGRPAVNSYGTTEGLMGSAPPGTDVFDFASDVAIVEFVDGDGRPVPAGSPADHVLVTNLVNGVQPLIRYRIDDVMTEIAHSADHGHQRARVEGRNDEVLPVGDVIVHPLTIRSALLAQPAVADYQVTVRPGNQFDIVVVPTSVDPDLHQVELSVRAALVAAGAAEIRVTTRLADALARDPRTGKIRRFIVA